MRERIELRFWKKLEALLYPKNPKIKRQSKFKVKLNDYWMNFHRN